MTHRVYKIQEDVCLCVSVRPPEFLNYRKMRRRDSGGDGGPRVCAGASY